MSRVSEDFVQQPSDETIAAGEHVNWEALAAHEAAMAAGGRMNPYASPEEQGMELEAKTFGPPQYGSPDPLTSVSKLATLEDGHPLDPGLLPEGTPAAISEDYGAVVVEEDDEEDEEDFNATEGAKELAEAEGVDLSEIQGSGSEGRIVKGDVEDYIANRENS